MILYVPRYFYHIFVEEDVAMEKGVIIRYPWKTPKDCSNFIWLKAECGRAGKLYNDQAEEKPEDLSKWAMSSMLLLVWFL